MRIKGIIFDMDGLMFDTERIYYKAWQEAAKNKGYEMTWEIYNQIIARNSYYIGKVLKGIYGESFPYESVLEEKRRLSDEVIEKKGMVCKPGLMVLLDFLEANHFKKVVATSSMREKALKYLAAGKVKERFDGIICGSEVAESKPNPEIFLKAAEMMELKPEECLVLEDSRFGIQAAKRAGMRSIFVPDLVECDEEIKSQATEVKASLNEVIDYLCN